MEYSGRHPEFGLLCPPARVRRELRLVMTSLLVGGLAGAVGVYSVIAFRHTEGSSSAAASAQLPRATGAPTGADSNAPESGLPVGTAAAPKPAETSAEPSVRTSARAAELAPKARVVRIPRTPDSPAIARLSLGRSETPVDPPPSDHSPASPGVNTAGAAGDAAPAAASEKPVAQSGAGERTAGAPTPKRAQKTVRAAILRRNEARSDYTWRDQALYDRKTRSAAVNDTNGADGRAYEREGSASVRGFWDWSR